jgi:hypothetical protein
MSWLNDIIGGSVNRAVTSVVNSFSPSMSRLASAGLPFGGSRFMSPELGNANINFSGSGAVPGKDWRVKVSTNAQTLSYSGIMAPLNQTQGVIFPYTPQITVTHQANYTPQRMTHSNYPAYAYENSEVQVIQINAEFTVQNKNEANYLLACIYFFRSATKMFFGTGENVGNPPPIVYLDGYGSHYFPHVSCLVTQFSHTLPAEVDYIETGPQNSQDFLTGQSNGSTFGNYNENLTDRLFNSWDSPSNSSSSNSSTRVPTTSTLSISLQPVYSKKATSGFSLAAFSRGDLINKGFL